MGIIKNAIQNQINTNNRLEIHTSAATILEYDKIYNLAKIRYSNPTGEGYLIKEATPIANSLGAMTTGGLQVGQTCSITFINGNILAPVITGITDSTYNDKTNTRQGAYLIDEDIREIQSSTIVPMVEDWIDKDNIDKDKYDNYIGVYSSLDANAVSHDLIMDLDKYKQDEVGITNLDTKSTLKMRSNGDIDIFVENNIGIRISKKNHKIYFYGFEIGINGEYNLIEILNKCKNCPYEPEPEENKKLIDDLMKDIEKLFMRIDGDIQEFKKCVANTKIITGDTQVFSDIDEQIQQYETLKSQYRFYEYDTLDKVKAVYNQVMDYYNYFCKELALGRKKWGLD